MGSGAPVREREDALARLAAGLGHRFANPDLLEQALRHRSAAHEEGVPSFERLEFLGDAALSHAVAALLFARRPDASEGELTRARAALVREESLARLAERLGLPEAINLGSGLAESSASAAMLADAFEATLGALYLDAGLETARAYVMRVFEERLTPESLAEAVLDPKSELQEFTMATSSETPTYRIVAEDGPPHERVFTAEVLLGDRMLGQGSGASKKDAEKAAAAQALQALAEAGERPPTGP